MISLRAATMCALFCFGVGTLAGCGASLSGPDSHTSAGLGTLVVRVSGDNALVTLDDTLRRTVQGGRATFLNVSPGRHFVEARSQSIGLPGESRSVQIVADKTLTISLSTSSFATPIPFPVPTPFGN